MAREPRAGGLRAVRLHAHAREGRALRRRARGARGGRPAARGGRGRRRRRSRWSPTRPRSRRCCSATDGAADGAAPRARWRSTCPRSPRPPRRAIGERLATTAWRSSRRPVRARGRRPRTARSRSWWAARRRTSSAPGRCSRRWASGSCTWARAGHGAMAKLLTNTMGAVNAAALAEAVLAVETAGLDPDAFLEVAAGSAGDSTDARPEGRADVRARLRARSSSSSTCSRTCATAWTRPATLGVELRLGRRRGAASTRGPRSRDTERRTSPP